MYTSDTVAFGVFPGPRTVYFVRTGTDYEHYGTFISITVTLTGSSLKQCAQQDGFVFFNNFVIIVNCIHSVLNSVALVSRVRSRLQRSSASVFNVYIYQMTFIFLNSTLNELSCMSTSKQLNFFGNKVSLVNNCVHLFKFFYL